MRWSPQQERALSAVNDWMNGPEQVFYLGGYAGTGKTTLAKHLAEGVDRVRFAAFTGKAAHILQKMGCRGAGTIHSLIYIPKNKSAERLRQLQRTWAKLTEDDPRRQKLQERIRAEEKNLQRPSFVLNEESELRNTNLLVVDESSMVNDWMGTDLLSFGCKVLVLGDPAQLPPPKGGGFFTKRKPDMLLTEIHRQSTDSPILEMATTVREGRTLAKGTYGSSLVTSDVTPEMAMDADQIITGRNKTRHLTNKRMRKLNGFTGTVPNVGERLVCVRNNHDMALLNGSVWGVLEVYNDDDPICMSISPDDEDWAVEVLAHRCLFEGQQPDWALRREANEFEWGYAMTCHKAQGSQWDHVLVIDESSAFKGNSKQWLYTALTRAAEKVVVKV